MKLCQCHSAESWVLGGTLHSQDCWDEWQTCLLSPVSSLVKQQVPNTQLPQVLIGTQQAVGFQCNWRFEVLKRWGNICYIGSPADLWSWACLLSGQKKIPSTFWRLCLKPHMEGCALMSAQGQSHLIYLLSKNPPYPLSTCLSLCKLSFCLHSSQGVWGRRVPVPKRLLHSQPVALRWGQRLRGQQWRTVR